MSNVRPAHTRPGHCGVSALGTPSSLAGAAAAAATLPLSATHPGRSDALLAPHLVPPPPLPLAVGSSRTMVPPLSATDGGGHAGGGAE